MPVFFNKLKESIFKKGLDDAQFLAFLLYLTLLTIFPAILTWIPYGRTFFNVLIAGFIFYSILLLNKVNPWIIISGTLAIILLLTNLIFNLDELKEASWVKPFEIITIGTFLILFGVRLLKEMLTEDVSLRLIYISIANYLIIGILFNFLFQLLHYANENAFNFSSSADYNHMYMSFMVLCSVGLGDLLPLSQAAKALVLIEAVSGQLYLTFFVSIIIGKYLNARS